MKVACESCSTKYSIDDGKVAGKVFKIRCRKCGQVIVLRGEPGATSAALPAWAEPAWYAVQDGRQIGPFDSGELQRRRAAGELDDDSYVWREGLIDWQPLGGIDELRSGAAPVARSLVAEPGASAGAQFADGSDGAADASRLRGERNETSVLFTLAGLAKMAVPGSPPARAAAPAGSSVAGATGGEGSGLIDIRSLARAYAPVTQIAAVRPSAGAATSVGSPADLPVFPSGTFVAPSVLIPAVPRRDRRIVVGLAAAFGLLAICAMLLVVIAFTRDGQPAAGEPRSAGGPRVAEIDPPAAPRTATPAVVEAPAAPVPVPPEAGHTAAPPAAPARPPAAPARPPVAPARPPVAPARPPAAPARPPAAPAVAQCDQVTCIVNGYNSECCRALQGGAPAAPTGPTPAASVLPENLDRAAITAGLATISTKRCGVASPATGLVKAHLKVSAAGAVTSVNVETSPDPALSACVVEQAQRGKFRPTQRGGSFSYVWRF